MNYAKLGLKCGLEIHQQLDTNKLFCNCPSVLKEGEPDVVVKRKLHPVAGELGIVDPAALQAYLRGRAYAYNVFKDCDCLVELDEEPPHSVNKEALETVILVSLLLKADVIDELHVMRKTVVDGSNVSGFQRTSLIAVDGSLDIGGLKVKIPTICLEEDAARKIKEEKGVITYGLDRLGIPLIELATDPCIHTPEDARKVARALGDILRATKKVKRGIGTIRQDLNISIKDGARIEIKGVQELNMLSKYVENEVKRQISLVEIKKELKKRKAKKVSGKWKDVTNVLKNSSSKVIKGAVEKKGIITGLKLEKFEGLPGKEVQPGRRFGTELADYAKAYGARGLFHSDELPAYGITEKEVEAVKKSLGVKKGDAFILIADRKEVCENAMKAVIERANKTLEGVPEETRKALLDGNSAYMRPLPGGARMYPETDLPPVVITDKLLTGLKKKLPELPWKQVDSLGKKYRISKNLAEDLYRSDYLELFEKLAKTGVDGSIVATTITSIARPLEKEHGISLSEKHYVELFKSLKSGKFSKEALQGILEEWFKKPDKSLAEIMKKLGIETVSEKSIEKVVEKIVRENKKLVEEKGERAIQPLMGIVMRELRGKADGKTIMEVLKRKVLK